MRTVPSRRPKSGVTPAPNVEVQVGAVVIGELASAGAAASTAASGASASSVGSSEGEAASRSEVGVRSMV